jgi:putative spermidine/putrescine transport system ATP-binding protein
LRADRAVGHEVTIALRPEAISIAPSATENCIGVPNTTLAIIEQIIYHGFVTHLHLHLHLRLPNDDPLLAFARDGAALHGMPISPGIRITAQWTDDAVHIVRDPID